MKVLKSGKEYVYDDFAKLQCSTCKKKLWDQGQIIINTSRLRCPECGTVYNFEATQWRVLAEIPID